MIAVIAVVGLLVTHDRLILGPDALESLMSNLSIADGNVVDAASNSYLADHLRWRLPPRRA